MSLQGFQQALADLVASPEMRALACQDPDAAFARYQLNSKDRRRLEALAHDRRGMGAGNLIHNSFRLGLVAETLPKTLNLLGPARSEPLLKKYWHTTPPKDFRYSNEAFRFADHLRLQQDEGELDEPFLEEVLNFELTTLSALQHKSPPPKLLEFRHDPEVLLPALEDPDVDPRALDLEEGEYYVLVRRLPSGDLDARPIPPALAAQLMGSA